MQVKSLFLQHFHLDQTYYLMSGRCARLLNEYFNALDVHNKSGLNDIQFSNLMKVITDLTQTEILFLFELFDLDASGILEFGEFYLMVCILIATKDNIMKGFIHMHSRVVFDLLDANSSGTISVSEFKKYGFFFDFTPDAINGVFHEFDVSHDQVLDYREFRMFALACVNSKKEMNREEVVC
ncbi:hypothetical protein LSH36_775g00040 [Paralvinella palmiformis]|uniref:EF-hand domain-containing protein n=1 Tax=Paralvinella palmiformis TaxID=53620 RepID=A0AAD9J0Z3_9ANNE|nr:hypothetical protein LSH36_775g00040 [Paralvinella palmiformis]